MHISAIDNPPVSKKDEVLRYIALLASSITLGEGSPAQVNWRYIRDQTMLALAEPEVQPITQGDKKSWFSESKPG